MSQPFEKVIHNCVCGREHTCSIRDVVIGEHAVEKVPELLDGIQKVLIVSDANTRPLAMETLTAGLAAHGIAWTEAFFDQTEVVIPNEKSVEYILGFATADVQALVGIGSGVISDLCKYSSHQLHLPYMIIATAPSMDGYASVGAAMILDGMKVTPGAHVPAWIVGDVNILKNAPMKMIRAGIGDILGKYSCLNDWKLASIVLGEYLCPWVYDLVMKEVQNCVSNIDGCMARDPKAIGDLMNSLVMVGVAMAYVGNSRPASGSEHHFSHFFEITGIVHGREYLDHGIDVAYSAILTAQLRSMLAAADPDGFAWKPRTEQWEKNVDQVYASLAPEVKKLQNKVGFYDTDRTALIREKWSDIQAVLGEAPSRKEMELLLQRAGYDVSKFVAFYSEPVIRTCIEYAKDLKDRYTLLNLLQDTGMLSDFAGQLKLQVGWKGFERRMLVAGHRGARQGMAENVLSTFQYAMDLGVDMIETDVRMTRDGHLVLMHDETVDRTTDGSGKVSEMTLAEFKALNAACHFGGQEAPPTLEEFLKLCQQERPEMLLNFELKDYPTPGSEAFAYECCDRAVALAEKYGYKDKCVLNSFSGKLLEYIHEKYNGSWRLHGFYPFHHLGEMTADPAKTLYCCCLWSKDEAQMEQDYGALKALGIVPWVGAGVKTREQLQYAMKMGAELVTTDDPAQTMEIIAELSKENEHGDQAAGV